MDFADERVHLVREVLVPALRLDKLQLRLRQQQLQLFHLRFGVLERIEWPESGQRLRDGVRGPASGLSVG